MISELLPLDSKVPPTHDTLWFNQDEDEDEDEDEENAERSASIPSWSTQDRFMRALVIPKLKLEIFGSSLFLGLVYSIVYLIPQMFRGPSEIISPSCLTITLVFIFLQTFVTLICAIPRKDCTSKDVNLKVDASILIAMTLYPCLGLWFGTRPMHISFWEFLLNDINNFWEFESEVSSSYQWGQIFPFFFWSTSACIFIRESNFSFTQDQEGVVSDQENKAMTALFRRFPSPHEKFSHKTTRYLTFSLWSILPSEHRPAGGVGRFAFQLVAPFVFIFFYVGWRFILFASSQIYYILNNPDDYTGYWIAIERFGGDDKHLHLQRCLEVFEVRFYVWLAFCIYCIIIRSLVGTRYFLSFVISDPQTLKHRWIGWSEAMVESKRRRVLWAFRGLVVAAVPLYVVKSECLRPHSALDWIMYYLYLAVYVSFFSEGAGAIFFGLSEAQKSCHLSTPFELFTDLWFWAAFNGYLQPIGTLVNIFFWVMNKEYLMKLHIRELLSPALLTKKNKFRFRLPKSLQKGRKKVTQEELNNRLEEWIDTWRRKRLSAGRCDKNIVIKKKDNNHLIGDIPFTGDAVFFGTLFPPYDEWIYMRDHYDQYIPMLPWELHFGPEKFLKWYPTYREEIISLLSEPYDFETQRTVWMFGYGSLISPDNPPHGLSKDQMKQIIPYWLKKQAGYRRVWNYRHGPVGINAFGLEEVNDTENEGMNICGCLYPMDYEKASDLFSFREEGYELLLIDADFFEAMHPDFKIPEGVGYVWVCGQPTLKCGGTSDDCFDMACKRHNPTTDSPILQSYIDTVLEGALRYSTTGHGHVDGMNFAAAIISSTTGWNYPWYNDRILAGRPWSYLPNYELIDGLLATCPTSCDSFVQRQRTSMETMSLKVPMFEAEKANTKQWSNNFFLRKNKIESNSMTVPNHMQHTLTTRRRRMSKYATNQVRNHFQGSGNDS